MKSSIEYLNNYNYKKIQWDNYIEQYKNVTQAQINDTVLYALDTESTNYNNERCITYATQLMEFGTKKSRTNEYNFINSEDRIMNLYT